METVFCFQGAARGVCPRSVRGCLPVVCIQYTQALFCFRKFYGSFVGPEAGDAASGFAQPVCLPDAFRNL